MTDTAIELEKLYFSTPATAPLRPLPSTRFPAFLPAAAAAATTAVFPLVVSSSSWRDGGACAS